MNYDQLMAGKKLNESITHYRQMLNQINLLISTKDATYELHSDGIAFDLPEEAAKAALISSKATFETKLASLVKEFESL